MFEWDESKAKSNFVKHKISFVLASSAFSDPLGLDGIDVLHSTETELRHLRVAQAEDKRILTIVYTLRNNRHGETKIRIISARLASKKEKGAYSSS